MTFLYLILSHFNLKSYSIEIHESMKNRYFLNMKTKISIHIAYVIIFLFWAGSLAAQVTTGTLLKEMIDLKSLSQYPTPAYTTTQFSSYDRHSISPDLPGWFGNEDGFGGETIPGFKEVLTKPGEDGIGRYLICDINGPGAMVRIWTARINGNLEVYLDGSDKPLYNGPAQNFIYSTYDAIAGTEAKYDQDGIFFQNTAGYYPIPFRKGFKLIWTGKIEDLHFYHVQVRKYAPEIEVETFRLEDLDKFETEINHVFQVLSDPLRYHQTDGLESSVKEVIAPEQEDIIFKVKGAQAISELMIQLEAEDLSAALRQSILKIRFDGASAAQVQSPVGDFFGAAPGINPYSSLPLSVNPEGSMICHFYMPFKDSVEIVLQNLGQQEVTVKANVITETHDWNGNSMYFRARWRIDHGLLASYSPSQDIPYLFANGKGVCVGAAAYIYNPTSVPSSWGNWWGEGDEKIYIDQGSFPDFYGTGSEDYFNYAWSSSEIFTNPYCGQPRNDGPANRGFVTNYRWHILDQIPFTSGLSFYMELMSHEPVENFSYGRMVYLYAEPGMYDDHLPITKEDVRILKLPDNWYPIGKKGSNKAIFSQAEMLVDEKSDFNLESDKIWSGDKILVWEPASSEDKIILNIEAEKAGEYTIVFTLGKDQDGGKFTISHASSDIELRGSTIIDLYDPHRILSRNYRSAPLELQKGKNEFIIFPADGNEGKLKLDFIWLMERN